jgi:threonine/homoserine/homoserine lactone efflux protein
MSASTIPAFLLAVLLISASPGPAMALIFRRSAVRGPRAAVHTILGLELGIYLWALAAGAGLAALVAASQLAYTVLRVVGAAFLLGLGLRTLWSALRRSSLSEDESLAPASFSGRAAFLKGLVVQLANPKAAAFMFAFSSQFIPADAPVLAWTAALAAVQVTLETGLYLGLSVAVGRASAWFRRPKIRQRSDAVTGVVLIALGVRVAATSR